MKPIITLLLLVFTFQLYSQHFVKEGRVWHRYQTPTFSPGYTNSTITCKYPFFKDGKQYYEVYETLEKDSLYWHKIGIIREDSIGKVYYEDPNDPEHLIYDFGSKVGDTIFYNTQMKCGVQVLYIDTILILNGEKRKRWNLSNIIEPDNPFLVHDSWIDGVGSTHDPLCKLYSLFCSTDYFWDGISCFYENGILLYMNSWVKDCFVTATNEQQSISAKIFPNPASRLLNIQMQNPTSIKYQIFNVKGIQVLQGDLESSQSIELQDFSEGNYYLLLNNKFGAQSLYPFIKN
ncbi:MAG: T9SS type A sorting domain-containing protein [Saprospiraceae bacterium]|nr:T9SS type A sorting domain-containing protein [Saprospiraceae bacterium]